jgi:hypothetical protein
MKLINVTAKVRSYLVIVMVPMENLQDTSFFLQGFLAHKGSEAESFYIIIRGEAEESIKLTLNESNERYWYLSPSHLLLYI